MPSMEHQAKAQWIDSLINSPTNHLLSRHILNTRHTLVSKNFQEPANGHHWFLHHFLQHIVIKLWLMRPFFIQQIFLTRLVFISTVLKHSEQDRHAPCLPAGSSMHRTPWGSVKLQYDCNECTGMRWMEPPQAGSRLARTMKRVTHWGCWKTGSGRESPLAGEIT